ncbi:MAG: DUF4112 domain-containing protein [Prevotellaceae bacterium]|nr:DUF4112 domain-containing protein [Prevotellaceae bacterium]
MTTDKDYLFSHPAYRSMQWLAKVMDQYFVDPILSFVLPGGTGDIVSSLLSLPFIYFSLFVVKSIPLTLAVIVNILRDILLGMLPFFVGDVIDFFFRSYGKNLNLITGYIEGDPKIIGEVHRKTALSIILILILLALIILLFILLWKLGAWLLHAVGI